MRLHKLVNYFKKAYREEYGTAKDAKSSYVSASSSQQDGVSMPNFLRKYSVIMLHGGMELDTCDLHLFSALKNDGISKHMKSKLLSSVAASDVFLSLCGSSADVVHVIPSARSAYEQCLH